MFVRSNQQQDAIVFLLLAEPPGAKKRVGVRLDLVALERFYRRHNELNAGFGFKRGKLWGDTVGNGGRNNIGGIHDTPGQGRKRIGHRQVDEGESRE